MKLNSKKIAPFFIAAILFSVGIAYQNCGQTATPEASGNDILQGIFSEEGHLTPVSELPPETKTEEPVEEKSTKDEADKGEQPTVATDSKIKPAKEPSKEESTKGDDRDGIPVIGRRIDPCKMDTNGNGVIDKIDQKLLYQMMQNGLTLAQIDQFDINNDAQVNQTEILYYPSHIGEVCQKFKKVIAGHFSSCGISKTDKVYCWGGHEDGQLGNGATANQLLPQEIDVSALGIPNQFKDISAGMNYYCGVHNNDKVYCWGRNQLGQLGNGNNLNQPTPVEVNMAGTGLSNSFLSVAAGVEGDDTFYDSHTCAVHISGAGLCWGENAYAQLGTGNTTSSNVPVFVDTTQFSSPILLTISAGSRHSCALDSNHKVYCWGENPYGQLGNGNNTLQQLPVEVNMAGFGLTNDFKKLSVGNAHTCAIHNNNKLYCWGIGWWSTLGNGDNTTNQSLPVEVGFTNIGVSNDILNVSSGTQHTCAIGNDNKAFCWGKNNWGQLGIGIMGMDQSLPQHVLMFDAPYEATFKQISAGPGVHTCGIHTNKKAYCWTANMHGQLGIGTTIMYSDNPTEINVTNVQ